jgi:hypothetical protein
VQHSWKKGKGVAIVIGLSPQLHIAPKEPTYRIAIRAGKKILFIDTADIIAVEAEGHYVMLQHRSSGYLLRESISTMEEKLSLFGFVRIHRSSLVNAAFVEEIQPLSTGEYMLRIRGAPRPRQRVRHHPGGAGHGEIHGALAPVPVARVIGQSIGPCTSRPKDASMAVSRIAARRACTPVRIATPAATKPTPVA